MKREDKIITSPVKGSLEQRVEAVQYHICQRLWLNHTRGRNVLWGCGLLLMLRLLQILSELISAIFLQTENDKI